MARLNRFSPVGIAQHIIQRGNNRDVCFNGDEDRIAYASWLSEFSVRFKVQIHAWVFMTNHVHLLVTPLQENAVSKMMQALGRQYVRYYNYTYKRSGTLWEGRFKSCLVDSANFLLLCQRYIELNPVRAAMVNSPEDYKWSSYRTNALGKPSTLITQHIEYLKLGSTPQERCKNYRDLFNSALEPSLIKDIRESTNKALALGERTFKSKLEENFKRRVTPLSAGRKRTISKLGSE